MILVAFGTRPKDLKKVVNRVIINKEINETCPYGDGKSSEKIFDIIKKQYENF